MAPVMPGLSAAEARALEALRDLSSPRALVVRDGAEQRIGGAIFRFAPLGAPELLVALAAGTLGVLGFHAARRAWRR